MARRLLVFAVLISALASSAWAVGPTVTKVEARQWQDDSRKVEISYTLTDPDSERVYIAVAISNDGGSTYAITPTSVTGDIGSVRPGGRRTMVWNAKADYPTAVWSSCKARIRADDSSCRVVPGEMVYVPAGSFLMGNSGTGDDLRDLQFYGLYMECPQHWVYLSSYWIGKYEVTRGEYRRFMEAGGYLNPAYWSTDGWNWRVLTNRTEPYYWVDNQTWGTSTFTQTDNHPVVGVTHYEAQAFCKWAGARLPTEAEWEKAARWTGRHPNIYPWGDVWDYEKCNNYNDHAVAGGGYQRIQTAPVGSYPAGASPYGCEDMAGNVYERCADIHSYTYYSETPAGGWIDPLGPTQGDTFVFRGGDHTYPANVKCRTAYRSDNRHANESWIYRAGFRMAR